MKIDFFEETPDTRTEILAATYRALCKHGYAGLTLQTIGEEFDKSTSLIYHHYDSKDELLLECLDSMIDQLEASVDDIPDDPRESIEMLLELLGPEPEEEGYQFVRALVELRGQAPHHEGYRERFTRGDRVFEERLVEIVRAGVEQETFRDVDPERAGRIFYTVLTGVMVRRVTTDDREWMADVREEIEALLGFGSP